MSELAVMLVDKTLSDPYDNAKCYKKGDVVIAQPDGWAWGKEELTNPLWTIVKVPGLPLAQAQALCTPEPGVVQDGVKNTFQLRAFRLDPTVLSQLNPLLTSDGITRKAASVTLTVANITTATVQKTPIVVSTSTIAVIKP